MEDNCNLRRWDILKSKLNNIPVDAFDQFVQDHPEAVLIDCRKLEEHETIRIPGSLHHDYLSYDFWDRIETLPKSQPYLVYCNTCRRSTRTCTLMQNGGFTKVYNLDGGLKEWVNQKGDKGLIRDVPAE